MPYLKTKLNNKITETFKKERFYLNNQSDKIESIYIYLYDDGQ